MTMASTGTRASPGWIHDVFLSFSGKDTRNNFTAHLYTALVQRGIKAYMDDRELERGKAIEPRLWKAIEDSRFSVIIFSRNYASSPWCLDELAKIVDCMKEMGWHTVFPVFYDVDPLEVAEQTGSYGDAFVKHEQDFRENMQKVRSWRDSLTEVANLSGWDVRNRDESQIIKKIVRRIWYKLSCIFPSVNKDLVGIDSRVEVIHSLLAVGLDDVRIVGICGMGGMGKTTIARVVYDRFRWKFEGSCFLANVRESFGKHGPVRLQEQLLSEILMEKSVHVWDSYRGIIDIQNIMLDKKVLVVLDDVDKLEQLEMLAAEPVWFGPGSRILVTSRNKHVLLSQEGNKIYEVDRLNDDEALMLFSRKAFRQNQPAENYWELSERVVQYAKGLPLALEVIGSFLHGRSLTVWESAMNRMNEIPSRKIVDILQISFDGLEELERKIFLDIACFFKGMKKEQVTRILDGCGFHANVGIQVLIDKSLISVSRNEIWMHDLLQIMGREIVRRESPKEPGRRSRLWASEDVFHVLKNSTGREEVESIVLDLPRIEEARWKMKSFSKMSKLRLLKVHNVDLSQGLEYLSNDLRFLEWHAYPSKSLPSCFQPDKLVELDMSYSRIEKLWSGFKSVVNLRVMNFSYSLNLTETPDFTGMPNLERLVLEGCVRLFEVHPSLGHHKNLEYVNFVDCKILNSLPRNLQMQSLKVLTLLGCSELKKFPDTVGHMECLNELHLEGTCIEELPSSILHLSGLEILSLENCKNLKGLPNSIGGLKSLKKLDLSGCSKLKNVPESLGQIECLEDLDISGTAIRQPPGSIFLMKNVKMLSFEGCKIGRNIAYLVLPSLSCSCSLKELNLCDCNLGEGAVPEDIDCLSSLTCLDLSRNNFVSLPQKINLLSRLELLVLEDCRMLQSLPEVPSKVYSLNLNGCTSLVKIPDPMKLCSMKRSEFKCLNCWKVLGGKNLGLTKLKRYLLGFSNPAPGFGIAIPGSEIPMCFAHQNEGSSISVQVPPNLDSDDSQWIGVAVCVAFTASPLEDYGSPYLFCHFKSNERENDPLPMWISWKFIQVMSDHLWLFYLSFDYFKGLLLECSSNIELSFCPHLSGVKVKKCGVCLVPSFSSSLWTHDVFLSLGRGGWHYKFAVELGLALTRRDIKACIMRPKFPYHKAKADYLKQIENSRFSIIIFSRHRASLPHCLDELVKMVQCRKEKGQTILPVFYSVDISEVATLIGSYGQDTENMERFQSWKDCLAEVANLSRWNVHNGNESEVMAEIVEKIWHSVTISKSLLGI